MAESMTPEEILEAIHALSPDDQARIHEALAVAKPSPEGFNPMAMMQQMMGASGAGPGVGAWAGAGPGAGAGAGKPAPAPAAPAAAPKK